MLKVNQLITVATCVVMVVVFPVTLVITVSAISGHTAGMHMISCSDYHSAHHSSADAEGAAGGNEDHVSLVSVKTKTSQVICVKHDV